MIDAISTDLMGPIEHQKWLKKFADKWGISMEEMLTTGSFNRPVREMTKEEKEKEATNFASILESINEKETKLEPLKWYRLGIYGDRPVDIRFLPEEGGYETTNRPLVWEDCLPGSLVSEETKESVRITESFSLEENIAISREAGIWSNLFGIVNKTDLGTSGWWFNRGIEEGEYTISDAERIISNIEVSDGPNYNFGSPNSKLMNKKEQGTEELRESLIALAIETYLKTEQKNKEEAGI